MGSKSRNDGLPGNTVQIFSFSPFFGQTPRITTFTEETPSQQLPWPSRFPSIWEKPSGPQELQVPRAPPGAKAVTAVCGPCFSFWNGTRLCVSQRSQKHSNDVRCLSGAKGTGHVRPPSVSEEDGASASSCCLEGSSPFMPFFPPFFPLGSEAGVAHAGVAHETPSGSPGKSSQFSYGL